MATLNIKDFPQEFIEFMDRWGANQIPTLNRRQVVTTIVKEWKEQLESQQQEELDTYPEQKEQFIS